MPSQRQNGIVVGIVSSLDDPENLGRVRVKYPHLDEQQSDWARLATLMAGSKRGTFFRPEVEDEVLVGFEQGDPTRPYVLGSLWSKPDKPPEDDGKKTENNWRQIVSRSGHVLRLDDTRGKEKIEVIDKDKKRRIVIDVSASKIQITADAGDIEISAPQGKISLTAMSVELKSQTTMNVEGGAATTIKGATVNIN